MIDVKQFFIGLLVLVVICIMMYFYFTRRVLVRSIVVQDERLTNLERQRVMLDGMVSELSVDPETIKRQMQVLRKTNKDCRVCHSGGMSCKVCHPDFDGIITYHRERVEKN